MLMECMRVTCNLRLTTCNLALQVARAPYAIRQQEEVMLTRYHFNIFQNQQFEDTGVHVEYYSMRVLVHMSEIFLGTALGQLGKGNTKDILISG